MEGTIFLLNTELKRTKFLKDKRVRNSASSIELKWFSAETIKLLYLNLSILTGVSGKHVAPMGIQLQKDKQQDCK
jgi:hypothetical protein